MKKMQGQIAGLGIFVLFEQKLVSEHTHPPSPTHPSLHAINYHLKNIPQTLTLLQVHIIYIV